MPIYSNKRYPDNWKGKVTNGCVVDTTRLLWTKEWYVSWVGWSRTAHNFIPVVRTGSNLKLINCLFLELFIYYFCTMVDHGQLKWWKVKLWISKTTVKVFFFFYSALGINCVGPFPNPLRQRAAVGDSQAGFQSKGHLGCTVRKTWAHTHCAIY